MRQFQNMVLWSQFSLNGLKKQNYVDENDPCNIHSYLMTS